MVLGRTRARSAVPRDLLPAHVHGSSSLLDYDICRDGWLWGSNGNGAVQGLPPYNYICTHRLVFSCYILVSIPYLLRSSFFIVNTNIWVLSPKCLKPHPSTKDPSSSGCWGTGPSSNTSQRRVLARICRGGCQTKATEAFQHCYRLPEIRLPAGESDTICQLRWSPAS